MITTKYISYQYTFTPGMNHMGQILEYGESMQA